MLRVGVPLEPPILDPTAGAAAAIDDVTYRTIFEPLVTLAPDGSVRPLLATRWQVSGDGRAYVFTLRANVRFHDGEPFDARAVIYSLRRATAPGSTNAQRDAFANIAEVAAIDPLTVRIRLHARDADFLRLLSYGDAAMLPPRAGTQSTAPVGTGPFRFVSWRRGDRLQLARNAGYWGAAPHLAGVDFRFIADPSAAFAGMRTHDLDLFVNYPAPETLETLRRDSALAVSAAPSEGQVILALNERQPALADPRVRRAIQQAIDRRAIIAGAMYGYGTPIGSHFATQSPDYLDLTGVAPHDPAAARHLLVAAGYPNGFALTLTLPPQAYARRSGEIVAAELGAVGIRVAIRTVEWAQWLDEVHKRHRFDMTIVNHAEPFDYDIYGRPDYYFGYASPAYNALLAALKASDDPARRHQLLQAVQRRLAEDSANGFLFEYPRLGVADAALRDIWLNTPDQAVDWGGIRFADGGAEARDGRTHGLSAGPIMAIGVVGLLVIAAFGLGVGTVARRLGVLVVTLLVASLLIFLLVQVVPGDPAATMMGLEASPHAIAALRGELGLEGSAAARYGHWLAGVARGDFGTSYTYRVPVGGLIAERVAVSAPLALLATIVSLAVGIPAGYFAARARGAIGEGLFGWGARIGIAVPGFWLASLLVLVFAVRLSWVRAGGFPGWDAGAGPALGALVLPTLALGLPQAAVIARVTRTALRESMAEPSMLTARAKGLSEAQAIRRHALPNALGPVLTVLGLQLPFLLAGGAIIEAIFYLPGLGQLLLQAIGQRDLITVQAVVALLVAATVTASFVVDLAQAWLDPRLRGGGRR